MTDDESELGPVLARDGPPHAGLDVSADLAPVAVPRGPATYYRDDTTAASIVDEILAPPAQKRRRLVFPLVAVIAVGIGAASLSHRASTPRPHEERTVMSPTVTARPPSPEPVPQPAPTVVPTPHPPATTFGAVEVVCEPWCIVAVDGTRRGEDGRLHRLRIPVGSHRITATRLDDRQTRAVAVGENAQSVRFVFD